MGDQKPRNWSELPNDLMYSILLRLSVVDILLRARGVCRSWRRVCNDPLMWQKIDMPNVRGISGQKLDSLYHEAIDLSQGGLLDITIRHFCSDDLLNYIAHRSRNLRSLAIEIWHPLRNEVLVNSIAKLPLLETLEISNSARKLNLKAISHACPQLHTLKLNFTCYFYSRFAKIDDEYAIEIAESMPQLRHLELIGNKITDTGLNAILDNLHHLKLLDLRKCFDINFVGSLEKRCLEKIKELKCPEDPIADESRWLVI